MAIPQVELKDGSSYPSKDKRNRAPEHQVLLPRPSLTELEHMKQWCADNYGERWSVVSNRDGRWCCFWAGRDHAGHYRWCFSDERDLTFFLLRWS